MLRYIVLAVVVLLLYNHWKKRRRKNIQTRDNEEKSSGRKIDRGNISEADFRDIED